MNCIPSPTGNSLTSCSRLWRCPDAAAVFPDHHSRQRHQLHLLRGTPESHRHRGRPEGRSYFYSVIYGAAEDEDWTDPKVWKKANPSLGITVGIDKVKAACESAQQNPGEENAFRQLRLNQWVKQSVRWMPMDKWTPVAFPVSVGRSGRAHLLRRAGLVLHHGHHGFRAGVSATG